MVEAATCGAALAAARDAYPGLRRLIDDEVGHRRQHVNVFYNSIDESLIEDLDRAAADGDEILIIQSVSGGWG